MRETQSARQCDEHWRAPASDRRLFTRGFRADFDYLVMIFSTERFGQSDIGGRDELVPQARIGAATAPTVLCISTEPLKFAPSMIPTRGAEILPRTVAVAAMSTETTRADLPQRALNDDATGNADRR